MFKNKSSQFFQFLRNKWAGKEMKAIKLNRIPIFPVWGTEAYAGVIYYKIESDLAMMRIIKGCRSRVRGHCDLGIWKSLHVGNVFD